MRAPWTIALVVAACTGPERPRETAASAVPSPSAASSASSPSPEALRFERLYYPAGSVLFEKKRPARAGEWLDRFKEKGQSFLKYQSERPIRPGGERKVIVLQPLGKLGARDTELIGKMRQVMTAFFALPVELAPALPLPKKGQRKRSEGARSWTQHHTRVLLDEVLAPRLPKQAVVYVGVTLEDLYPEPSWNFVFGQATLEARVGVYSLARFFPEFWGNPRSPQAMTQAFAKSAQILVHETGHAFSMEHCTEYECVMNGSNSLEELDGQFGELCPVCLRKLAWNLGFDPEQRYSKLRDLYRREGVTELATWLDGRLTQIRSGTAPAAR
jgi:archaemetzincin